MESRHISNHLPSIRIHKNGRVERLSGNNVIPASLDPQNDVMTKEVVYSPAHNLSVRLFLPHKSTKVAAGEKLPLLIYFHGGGYVTESPFSPVYRRAPEHPVPAAYDDSWSAIRWIFSHSDGVGEEVWINEHADFDRVFVSGDSAGANISHHMAIRAGKEKLHPRIKGAAMVHPGFWGKDPVDERDVQDERIRRQVAEVWELASPNSVDGVDDPWLNVVGSGSDISGLGCERVLVAVAGEDVFGRQGLVYAAKLKKSWWRGELGKWWRMKRKDIASISITLTLKML